MKVEKTVKSAVVEPTNIKHKQLTQMWENYQRWLQSKDDDIELYSAHKQQAKRNLDFDDFKKDREYPLFIRKDLLSIQKCDSDLADYFFKIPSKQRFGGIKVPIKTHIDIKDNYEICETKLLKRGDKFFLHIMISKDVFVRERYDGVLSIDLGLRQPVVSVALPGRETMLDGTRIRDTQTRQFYLRRNTKYGNNLSRFYQREYNIVEDEIHKITTN